MKESYREDSTVSMFPRHDEPTEMWVQSLYSPIAEKQKSRVHKNKTSNDKIIFDLGCGEFDL